jgi:acetyl-CoA acetyltransferase
LNPEAFQREELTIRQYLSARLVSDPLGVRDCCLVTDGAAAIVMTRAERAPDFAERPSYVLGAASAT